MTVFSRLSWDKIFGGRKASKTCYIIMNTSNLKWILHRVVPYFTLPHWCHELYQQPERKSKSTKKKLKSELLYTHASISLVLSYCAGTLCFENGNGLKRFGSHVVCSGNSCYLYILLAHCASLCVSVCIYDYFLNCSVG